MDDTTDLLVIDALDPIPCPPGEHVPDKRGNHCTRCSHAITWTDAHGWVTPEQARGWVVTTPTERWWVMVGQDRDRVSRLTEVKPCPHCAALVLADRLVDHRTNHRRER